MSDIVDVDFRYVKSARNDIDPPVLQWRKNVPIASEETKDMPVPYIIGFQWTDWQEVRTDEE